MRNTIRNILSSKGIRLEDTPFYNSKIVDYCLPTMEHYSWDDGTLKFKNTVEVKTYEQIADIFSAFNRLSCENKRDIPYYTANLELIVDAINHKNKIAVEGGPCLFGIDEVNVIVCCSDKSIKRFDFACGKSYKDDQNGFQDDTLAQYLLEKGEQVSDIRFINRKISLTTEEYLQLRYPVEIASALNCLLVIPLPDMSYRKYLVAVLEPVSRTVRQNTLKAFDKVLSYIISLYLEEIERLLTEFKISDFCCLSLRTPDLLDIWYRKRELYIKKMNYVKALTNRTEYLEAVKDYVTMPALPYYLFDIKNILQIDSVYETDSYRKCRKLHKKLFNLGCVLTAEPLSKDGVTLEYDAPCNLKKYRSNINLS